MSESGRKSDLEVEKDGRRLGIERREISYTAFGPERRKGDDRRKRKDRRQKPRTKTA